MAANDSQATRARVDERVEGQRRQVRRPTPRAGTGAVGAHRDARRNEGGAVAGRVPTHRETARAASLEAARRCRWLGVLLALLGVVLCVGLVAGAVRLLSATQAPKPQQTPKEGLVVDAVAPAEQEQAAVAAEPVSVRLMMIGDILMHMGVVESGYQSDGSLNYDHLFAHILDDVAKADVAVLNQETILGGSDWSYSGYPAFNGPQEVGDAEADAGFDVILKATNHSFDIGYDGLKSELDFWANKHPGMAVIGAADPYGTGIAPAGGTSPAGAYVYEKGGLRIALLNYTSVLNSNVDVDYDDQVLAIMDEDRIAYDLAEARAKADIVVVFAHWGEEYQTVPNEDERYWADVFKDAGADVVIGGHPHVIQPVEVLGGGDRDMLVCWSVGNFVSTQNDARNMVGGMVNLDIVKDAEGARVAAYEFVPTVTQKEPWTTNMSAYKLMDYTDELAAQSVVSSWAGEGGNREWYLDFCSDVLGDAFDRDACKVRGTL